MNAMRNDYDETSKSKYNEPIFTFGYALLLASFLFYVLVEYFGKKENLFTIFWIHYALAMVYTFALIGTRAIGVRKSWSKNNIDETVILLNLFLVSAYALNRELPVFESSENWFCVYINISSLAILTFRYFEVLPSWVRKSQ